MQALARHNKQEFVLLSSFCLQALLLYPYQLSVLATFLFRSVLFRLTDGQDAFHHACKR